jgi:hypothetical protein
MSLRSWEYFREVQMAIFITIPLMSDEERAGCAKKTLSSREKKQVLKSVKLAIFTLSAASHAVCGFI